MGSARSADVASRVKVSWATFIVGFAALIAFQQFVLGGPLRPSLPGAAPAGTSGIVSVLVIVAAIEAVWAAVESGRMFLYFSLGLVPSLVVLYGGVQSILDGAAAGTLYFLQALVLLLALFVAAGLSKKVDVLPNLSMDAKLHKAVFWSVHGLGVLVAIGNLVS